MIVSRTWNVAQVFPAREKDMVDTFTFAELQQLDVGEWFNRRFPERARKTFAGLRILRLEDIVEIAEGASNEIGLFIELKSSHRFPGIEQQLVEGLRKHGWIDRPRTSGHAALIFQSFEPESLERSETIGAGYPTSPSCGRRADRQTRLGRGPENRYRSCYGHWDLGVSMGIGIRVVTEGEVALYDHLALVHG